MGEPVPAERMRASDIDRKAIQDRLHEAHAAGLISLSEFDSRVGSAWDAKTRGELAEVVADLPLVPRSDPRGRRAMFARDGGGIAMRVLTIVWLSASMVNLVVWGLVAVSAAEWIYPWWVWILLPPGAVLTTLYMSGVGRPKPPRELGS
jgi:hypothetical protein